MPPFTFSLLSDLSVSCLRKGVSAIWTSEPDTTTIIIIVITIIICRSKHRLNVLKSFIHAHTNYHAHAHRCGTLACSVCKVPLSSLCGGERRRELSGRRTGKQRRKNRFFYKEKNNEAALGILLHKNPREKVLLPYSFSLFLD